MAKHNIWNHCKYLHKSAEKRAKEKGRDYELSAKIIGQMWREQEYKCHYTGVTMQPYNPEKPRNPYAASLDRVDNDKGYVVGNVVLCLWVVNRMKSDLPLSEFKQLCYMVSRHER